MISEESVYKALETVLDPEIGIDIVNLGFVYDVKVKDDHVSVAMTLTTRGCPLHSSLQQNAEKAIRDHTGAASVEVKIVFDPPWNPAMMSDMAKAKLGFDENVF